MSITNASLVAPAGPGKLVGKVVGQKVALQTSDSSYCCVASTEALRPQGGMSVDDDPCGCLIGAAWLERPAAAAELVAPSPRQTEEKWPPAAGHTKGRRV